MRVELRQYLTVRCDCLVQARNMERLIKKLEVEKRVEVDLDSGEILDLEDGIILKI